MLTIYLAQLYIVVIDKRKLKKYPTKLYQNRKKVFVIIFI